MSDPLQGYDVTISIIGENGPELVGQYQEAEITVTNELQEYLETGERIPRQLDGQIGIEGKLTRGMLHVDVIQRIMGSGTIRRGEAIPQSPRFTIETTLKNANKGYDGRIRVEQAVFNELALSITAGAEVVKKDLSFKAEGISQA
ncbi:hypothetical protein M3079_02350 [Phascolarctobacterium sp. ET69]|uniref:hypothetical protein n=1 Tax=Phascolarctobacterium sp. ET69 TaxID=2939420 RepID=UPI0020135D95|nr:hypothetical protein [Phascolarctobacterium sp. ET69]MCL1604825.1 hypothetical protein [Phascolarctobacterium sp. ET69]